MQADILQAIRSSNNDISGHIDALANRTSSNSAAKGNSILEKWREGHETDFSQVERKVVEAVEYNDREHASQMVLDSLFYEQLHDRHDAVAIAHATTFRWIYDAQHVGSERWSNFGDWLSKSQSNNLYWVTGKPGSGKSTLMKFVIEDARTESCLRQWAGYDELLLASCFFWISGDYMQRSYEGLLRSLLFQLLSKRPRLIQETFPWRWRSYLAGAMRLRPWTNQQLLKAFQSTLESLSKESKICLFIDGLDEYEGDDEARSTLLESIKGLASNPQVKVCASSRPWVIFQDAFEGSPALQLHHLTRQDIINFIDDELVAKPRFEKMQAEDPIACQQLRDEIIEKAEGVFLWVRLVVRDLLQCLRNRDGIKDLHRRLRSMPSDLKAFLESMFNRLDDFYIEEAVVLFRVALAAWKRFTLLRYSLVLQAKTVDPVSIPIKMRSRTEIVSKCEDAEWQLNSRCQGLLEVITRSSKKDMSKRKVDFLHRSVRDFLLNGFLDQLHDRLPARIQNNEIYNTERLIAGAVLAQMKILSSRSSHWNVEDNVQDLLVAARLYEYRTDKPLFDIMDELHRIGVALQDRASTSNHNESSNDNWGHLIPQQDACFLEFVFNCDLLKYFEYTIRHNPSINLKKEGRPLLFLVLMKLDVDPRRRFDLVELLLKRGADPNECCKLSTVWGHYLGYMAWDAKRQEHHALTECIDLLINYGAYKVGSNFDYGFLKYTVERYYGRQVVQKVIKALKRSKRQRWLLRMTKEPKK